MTPRRLATLLAPLAAAALMAGCTVTRPPNNVCPALPLSGMSPGMMAPDAPVLSTQSASPATVNAMIAAIGGTPGGAARQEAQMESMAMGMVEDAMRAEARRTPAAQPITVRILTMSAGGQWGAYGAGLMTGWSQNPARPRPAFDVVTGVSAGSILAVPVFAGPQFDPALEFFRGISAEDVSRRRNVFALLRAPSLNDNSALEAFLDEAITPQMIDAIARRHEEGDQILVSATSLENTAGEIFDIGATARMADREKAADCITEAILASSAIPGLFPPRHINGSLYADGGLRDQVFFRAVDTARARVARELGRPVRVEAYVVVNGALMPPTQPPDDKLLSYLGRSVVALADEVQRDSIIDAVNFAENRPNWTLRGMVPRVDLSECGFVDAPVTTFDPCLTRVVFDKGLADGRAVPIDWMDAGELRAVAEEL